MCGCVVDVNALNCLVFLLFFSYLRGKVEIFFYVYLYLDALKWEMGRKKIELKTNH